MPHSMLSLGHAKALDTPRSLHAVCRWIRRGHHASLPGAQGEGVHVPDTTAEAAPSSAAAQTRCQGLMRSVRTRTCSSYMVDLSIRHHLVVATVAYYDLLIFFLLFREIVEDCLFCCKRSSTVTNEQPLCLFRRNLCLLQAHPFVLPMSVFVKSFVLTDYVYKIYSYLCAM
jgi:hypothetical protein